MGKGKLPTGPELERKLERVECAMYADLYAAVPPDLAASFGFHVRRDGEQLGLAVTAVDHPFFNRVLGMGLDRSIDAAWLERSIAPYRWAGIRRFMLQVLPHLETPDLLRAFENEGLVRLRGWAKHVGPAGLEVEARSDLRVEPAGVDRAADWAAICAEGFSLPAAMTAWLEATVERPRWHHYLASDGETPVACAAFFREGDFATLTFAATRPEARGRGGQSALIARRFRDAAALGCRWIMTETDEEQPDRPNPSTHNVVRLGLPVRFVRANWGPPKPA